MTQEEQKALEERIEAIEKRLDEINKLIEMVEGKRARTITQWTDGPIMMFGKHNIDMDQINKKED